MTQTPSKPAPPTGPSGERRFPCGQCGAGLAFAAGTKSLRCSYCGHENPIPDAESIVREEDYEEQLRRIEAAAPTENHATVKCDACAGEVTRPANVTSLTCPFCGSNIVSAERCPTRIAPAALLPFAIRAEQARASYKKWIGGLWFAPGALKSFAAQDDRLAGVYTPYWTYDCRTTARYTGQRGEYYSVTVGTGNNRRQERRVRWYPASGVVDNSFNDVLVIASRSLPEEMLAELTPWDLKSLTPYDDSYLAGFRAESYQVGLAEGFEGAKRLMAPVIERTVCQDIGGDTQRITSVNVRYEGIRFKHILLPVWVSVYRFKGKVYRFLVNARTGEVQGERPYSWVKISAAVIAGIFVLGIIVMLVQSQR
jgi:DNA-directed RNA polymerase subunit RPC12/RpoP